MQALVVDDHELIRDALFGVLDSFAEIAGVIQAGTAAMAARSLAAAAITR